MTRFRFEKTRQAAACLLRREPSNRMNFMRLLKLLYIADRESLKETGAPVTGDCVVAMERGPVLSQTYDLIKGKHLRYAEWERAFKTDGYHIALVEDPGIGLLCEYEIDKLNEITERYRWADEWEMVKVTHEFPEWIKNKPGGSSQKPISLKDILEAVGRAADQQAIEEEETAGELIRDILGN